MDLDDDASKLRRNTLALSCLTLIFYFLDLKFPTNIFGFTVPNNSEMKIWIIISITSIYFFLRYFHCDDASELRRRLRENFSLYIERRKKRFLLIWFSIYKRGWPTPPTFKRIIEEFKVELASRYPDAWHPDCKIELMDLDSGYDLRSHIQFRIGFRSLTGTLFPSQVKIEVKWSRITIFSLWSAEIISRAINVRNIVDIFVPYILFISAMISLAIRFWQFL